MYRSLNLVKVLKKAFEEVSAYGLRVAYEGGDMETYVPTLSSFRFRVMQKDRGGVKEIEFGQSDPPFERDTLMGDLRSHLKDKSVIDGWFSILFSIQRRM